MPSKTECILSLETVPAFLFSLLHVPQYIHYVLGTAWVETTMVDYYCYEALPCLLVFLSLVLLGKQHANDNRNSSTYNLFYASLLLSFLILLNVVWLGFMVQCKICALVMKPCVIMGVGLNHCAYVWYAQIALHCLFWYQVTPSDLKEGPISWAFHIKGLRIIS